MTVSEYIFDFLQKKGCSKVFMVSGSSAMWLTDALKRNGDLKTICCHHEQAAAMAADGYGRVNDVPGICLVTIGPGATNAITGVAQAYLDSSPMFVISGQVNSKLLRYEMETGIRQHGTQSIDLKPLVSSITKYFAAIIDPNEIVYEMDRAYYEAMNGRKGPVWIDVPVDIQNRQIDNIEHKWTYPETKIYDDNILNIKKVAELIENSKKPLIMAGYGIRSADAVLELNELCEKSQIPIVTSRGGIDVIESNSKYFIGRPGSYGDRASHFMIQDADLLLILGSRLSVATIGYYPKQFGKNAIKVMVDIDEKELNKDDVSIDLKIQMDTKEFLRKLIDIIDIKEDKKHCQWVEKGKKLRDKYPTVLKEYENEKPLNEYYFTSILTKCASENANIIVDTGSVCNVVSQSWKIKKGQRYLISGGLSCMGFWVTALGACQKDRQIIAITGDGSAQMNIQELATLKYNNMPIKIFIYNNNGYMLIRHNQHNYMNDRFLGVGPDSGLQTPDYCKVANAYGIKSVRINAGDIIEENIKDVLSWNGPVVCEVMCREFAPIIPRIASRVMPDGSLKAADFDDLYPFLN